MQVWSVFGNKYDTEYKKGENFLYVQTTRTKYTFSILASPPKFSTFLPLPFHRKKVMTRNNVSVVDVVKNINLHVSSEPHFPFCLCKFMCSAFGVYL